MKLTDLTESHRTNAEEELIKKGKHWLQEHGQRDENLVFDTKEDKLLVHFKQNQTVLMWSSIIKEEIEFPDYMEIHSKFYILTNGEVSNFKWLSKKTFPHLGEFSYFTFAGSRIDSFEDLPSEGTDLEFKSCGLPRKGWGRLKKFELKKNNVLIHWTKGIGTDSEKVIDHFRSTNSVLAFQSALIDNDLESFF
jgi:hypothetical protein